MLQTIERLFESRSRSSKPVMIYAGPTCGKTTWIEQHPQIRSFDTDELVEARLLLRFPKKTADEVWQIWWDACVQDASGLYFYVSDWIFEWLKVMSSSNIPIVVFSNMFADSRAIRWDRKFWRRNLTDAFLNRAKDKNLHYSKRELDWVASWKIPPGCTLVEEGEFIK